MAVSALVLFSPAGRLGVVTILVGLGLATGYGIGTPEPA
jgi:hypothetical protein